MRLLSSAWAGCVAFPLGRLGWVGIDPPSPPAFDAASRPDGANAGMRPSSHVAAAGACPTARQGFEPAASPAVCLPLRIQNAGMLLPPAAARSSMVDAALAIHLLSADTGACPMSA